MKRHAIIVAIHANHSDLEISNFLILARSFVHKVLLELEACDSNVSPVSKRKKHSQHTDTKRILEFIRVQNIINENLRISMRSIAKELRVSEWTIRTVVHHDIRYNSYVMWEGQFVSAKTQDQKSNRRNDRWLCADPSEVPRVMHTKFPATVIVLGTVSSKGHVVPPHFFPQGLRINAAGYIEVLKTVIKPWIDETCSGRPFVFQQEPAPSYKVLVTQEWLSDNLYNYVTPNVWPPNSPDLNPMDYSMCRTVEREINCHPHNTIASLKVQVMSEMNKDHIVSACQRFRSHIEAVIKAEGGFIE
eukprot:XP_014768517.1 PREDICTED: uncharacterized protein LOC106867953 [Octopus bimaculoides]